MRWNLRHSLCLATAMMAASVCHADDHPFVFPPLATNLRATFTPHASLADSWELSVIGWRSASPTANLEGYGFVSVSSGGWEGFPFAAWSDDPASLSPAYDPNIEHILQTPQVWHAITTYATNEHGYTVTEFGLNAAVCVDEGCQIPLPNGVTYDPGNALVTMDPISVKASDKTKEIRHASPLSGSAGVVLVASLRQQGWTDAQIDDEYPGLLEPEITYITPTTAYDAYLNPLQYTVYNDAGVVVTGADLIAFLESKETPEQIIYEIVNGLPMSSILRSDGGDGGHDWKDIQMEVEISGGISGTTGFPNNSVSAHVNFRIAVKGTAGELVDGAEEAVAVATEVAQAAMEKIKTNLETRANAGDGGDDNGGGPVFVRIGVGLINIGIKVTGIFRDQP